MNNLANEIIKLIYNLREHNELSKMAEKFWFDDHDLVSKRSTLKIEKLKKK